MLSCEKVEPFASIKEKLNAEVPEPEQEGVVGYKEHRGFVGIFAAEEQQPVGDVPKVEEVVKHKQVYNQTTKFKTRIEEFL